MFCSRPVLALSEQPPFKLRRIDAVKVAISLSGNGHVSVLLTMRGKPRSPASEPELDLLPDNQDLAADEELTESEEEFVPCNGVDVSGEPCTNPTNGNSQLCHTCKRLLHW